MIYSDSDEDEIEVGPAIELQNTQVLRDQLQGKSLVGPIRHILTVMDGLGINLPIFLDALSWGDPECIQDAKIWYSRSALMNSKEPAASFLGVIAFFSSSFFPSLCKILI
jgi:hypothetical protein